MARIPLHERPLHDFIFVVVLSLIFWILAGGLVGGVIGTIWKGSHPGALLAVPGSIFGFFCFLFHFGAMMRRRSQSPSNPTPHADARDAPGDAHVGEARASGRER